VYPAYSRSLNKPEYVCFKISFHARRAHEVLKEWLLDGAGFDDSFEATNSIVDRRFGDRSAKAANPYYALSDIQRKNTVVMTALYLENAQEWDSMTSRLPVTPT